MAPLLLPRPHSRPFSARSTHCRRRDAGVAPQGGAGLQGGEDHVQVPRGRRVSPPLSPEGISAAGPGAGRRRWPAAAAGGAMTRRSGGGAAAAGRHPASFLRRSGVSSAEAARSPPRPAASGDQQQRREQRRRRRQPSWHRKVVILAAAVTTHIGVLILPRCQHESYVIANPIDRAVPTGCSRCGGRYTSNGKKRISRSCFAPAGRRRPSPEGGRDAFIHVRVCAEFPRSRLPPACVKACARTHQHEPGPGRSVRRRGGVVLDALQRGGARGGPRVAHAKAPARTRELRVTR